MLVNRVQATRSDRTLETVAATITVRQHAKRRTEKQADYIGTLHDVQRMQRARRARSHPSDQRRGPAVGWGEELRSADIKIAVGVAFLSNSRGGGPLRAMSLACCSSSSARRAWIASSPCFNSSQVQRTNRCRSS